MSQLDALIVLGINIQDCPLLEVCNQSNVAHQKYLVAIQDDQQSQWNDNIV